MGWWGKYYIVTPIILLTVLWWYLGIQAQTNRELWNSQLARLTHGFSWSYRVNGTIDQILYKNDFSTT